MDLGLAKNVKGVDDERHGRDDGQMPPEQAGAGLNDAPVFVGSFMKLLTGRDLSR